MLQHAARRALRLARQGAPRSAVCLGTRGRPSLALRSFSDSWAEGRAGSVKIAPQEAAIHHRTAAWEQKILAALRTYKDMKGDILVPTAFGVPTGDERWPSVTWGYKLGYAVSQLRNRLESKSPLPTGMKEELERMGFVRNVAQYKWDNIVLPALQRFHMEYEHADVPQEFVVPSDDETWPRLAWGYRLGNMVEVIRRKGAYSVQVTMSKEELDRIEFCYDMSIAERDWTKKILPSLRVYRQEFGDCIIAQSFIVPSCPPWPEKAWGMPLGIVVSRCRIRDWYAEKTTRDRPLLDALGFAWSRSDAVWNEIMLPALEAYVDVYKNGRVPFQFAVPSEAPWSERAWGKRLGKVLSDIRLRGAYFPHYGRDFEKLDELGVNLKLSSRAWQKRVEPLLDVYAELHGDEEIPREFVIPSEAPWEEKVWGVRLGLIVARNLQFAPRK